MEKRMRVSSTGNHIIFSDEEKNTVLAIASDFTDNGFTLAAEDRFDIIIVPTEENTVRIIFLPKQATIA